MPDRPPELPDDDVAEIPGTAFPPYISLTVVLSGVSLQSLGVMAPITTELRIVIVLLRNT